MFVLLFFSLSAILEAPDQGRFVDYKFFCQSTEFDKEALEEWKRFGNNL